MTNNRERGLTKLTIMLFAPMYQNFERQLDNIPLSRDAFLEIVIAQEIPHLREELKGKKLSNAANRYISQSLKRLGGKDAPPLRKVSIAVKHETAEALRQVVNEHNLVRDSVINRLIALLRASDDLLKSLGLPSRVQSSRRDGTEDMPTSPLRAIEETLLDPFHYLRAACIDGNGYGLSLLAFPEQLIGMSVYLADDQVPGTKEHSAAGDLWTDILSALTPATQKAKNQGD
jgi:hypothetical protein